MGTRTFRPGTTVLVLTSDAGLIRLARSILEPTCTVIGRAPVGANADSRMERPDLVIIDEDSVDHNVIATARRALMRRSSPYPGSSAKPTASPFWTRTRITWRVRFEPTISQRA